MNLGSFRINREWTLFLDRDGVINRRIYGGYVTSWPDFVFLPGVIEAFRILSGIFGKIIVVTNQQGISKGLMTPADLEGIHRRMLEEICAGNGRIDAVIFSPEPASANSIKRKPGVGMALEARKMFPEISFKKSVMTGDSLTDMKFGKRIQMKTVFISSDLYEIRKGSQMIDLVYSSLEEYAVDLQRHYPG
jgi:D-glycero-D-manno-heptose 1,7-bisphosphate phosphatase